MRHPHRAASFFAACIPLLLLAQGAAGQMAPRVRSIVQVYDLESGTARTVFEADAHYEAPNWTPDGKSLIINGGGRLYRLPLAGGTPEPIPTGTVTGINNDHGITPHGRTLVISAGSPSRIYTLPIEGGIPVQVTPLGPSYWHGVSPDGRTLAYVAQRDTATAYDLYLIPTEGGEETRLTADAAHDDGPDYSPDGRWIYWNSDRSGNFDIWRLPARGGDAEQVTRDAWEDWFPHPSPDGRYIVLLSYEPGTEGHPANRNVKLRLMPASGGEPVDLLGFTGGQGTINVPSWSPDSRAFAFVSYEVLPGEGGQ